jgi:hypothetical protein
VRLRTLAKQQKKEKYMTEINIEKEFSSFFAFGY